MTTKSLITTAAVALLALPAPASAHTRKHHHHHVRVSHATPAPAPRPNPIQAAITFGARYWHTMPCADHITVVYSTPPANDEAPAPNLGVSMWSSWESTLGPNNEAGAQPFTNCTIGVNSAYWKTEGQMAYEMWPEFAAGIIHEMGHLLGQVHSTDPQSVMNPDPAIQLALTGETLWSEE